MVRTPPALRPLILRSSVLGHVSLPDPGPDVQHASPWLVAADGAHIYTAQRHVVSPLDVEPELAAVLATVNHGTDLVPVGESVDILRARGIGLRAVTVDTLTGALGAQLVADGTQLRLGGRQPCDTCVVPGDPARALSAVNGELYSVVIDAEGGPERFVRTSVATGQSSSIPIAGVGNLGQPLSLTYRYANDSLYLLDRVVEGGRLAVRLVEMSRSGSGVERVRLPYRANGPTLYLTTTADDLLMLSVSGSGMWRHTSYFLLDPNNDLRLVGLYVDPSPGSLELAPDTLNRFAYSVAARRPGRAELQFEEIDPSRFLRFGPCHLLDKLGLL